MLQDYQPLIFIGTETRTTTEICDGEIRISGYKMVRSDSPSRFSGGVVFYYREDIEVSIVEDVCFGYNNILAIRVKGCAFRGLWFGVYHSPNSSHREFVDKMKELIARYVTSNENMYITGDFNIDFHPNAPQSTYANEILNFCRLHYLDQKVKKHTRVTQTSRTLIDPFFTDKKRQVKVSVMQCDSIADHHTIMVQEVTRFVRPLMRKIKDRTKYTKEAIRREFLSRHPVHTDRLDLSQRVENLELALKDGMQQLTSTRNVDLKRFKKWYNRDLKELKDERNAAHLNAQLIGSTEAWNEYKRLRNLYNNRSRAARNNNLRDSIVRLRHDPKKLWKEIKRLMSNDDEVTSKVVFDDQQLTEDLQIANGFNDFFINSVQEINGCIPYVPYVTQQGQNQSVWNQFRTISNEELWNIVCSIKTKSGIDDVNIDVIKDTFDLTGPSILEIVNESMAAGECPEYCKETTIIPIRKIPGTINGREFRPINMTRIVDKIMQNGINIQLQEFLANHEVLCNEQSGFRKKHSCESAVNLVVDEWKMNLNKKQTVIVMFLDLQRAFETVDRRILLDKMRNYGIGGSVLKWFETWLANRYQVTRFKEAVSSSKEVEIGLPQGTPLSCPLFNVYVNDIPKVPVKCKIKMFADDTVMWLSGEMGPELVVDFQRDIERLSSYLKMSKLKVNTAKTKYMVISRENVPQDWSLALDGVQLEKVAQIKYLGVIIDEKLNFKENTRYAKMKIAKKVYFLQRIRRRVDKESKLTLYKTLIVPHIDYCSTMLLMANECDYTEMQVICNKALRSILLADRYENVERMLNELDLLDVKQRIYYNTLMFVYKMRMGLLPEYLTRNLQCVGEVQPYVLRSGQQYRLPRAMTAFSQNCLFYKGVQMLNDVINAGHEVSDNINEFKKTARIFVKERYQSH